MRWSRNELVRKGGVGCDGGERCWRLQLLVSGGGSSGWWCEVVEVSAGDERWCRLVMVVRGVGGLRWRLRWWKFELMV